MKKYKVNEIFYSLQGEGYWTGKPAVFVRLSGCNRACEFCDTDFDDFREMTADEIAGECSAFPARHLVLTGGEPLLQLDEELVVALKREGFYIQVETNGSVPLRHSVDWVTCSPKARPWRLDPAEVRELKVVFTEGTDFEEMRRHFGTGICFLQPCSCENTKETIEYILAHPEWRLSLQTHKLLDIR